MATDLVYGRHAVAALIADDPAGVTEVWVQQGRRDRETDAAVQSLKRQGIAVHVVAKSTLVRVCGDVNHQGFVARHRSTRRDKPLDLQALVAARAEQLLLLVLDGVQDPRNLGACLRSADAAGVDAVLVPRHRAAGITPAVRKVACGAAESTGLLEVGNLANTLRELTESGVRVVGAEATADVSLFETDLRGALALVLGGEDRGLRRLTRERCDRLVRVPMAGRVPSLNVSAAAAVFLFEALRQRTLP